MEERKNLIGCEVGVDWGIHAEDILKNLDMAKLYLIDCWMGLRTNKRAKEKLAPFADNVVWFEKKSEDVTNEEIPLDSLDFVYIDGGHDYETVKKDLELYWPRVKIGGLLAGHDYIREKGVYQAVNEFRSSGNFKMESIGQDWWIWKIS